MDIKSLLIQPERALPGRESSLVISPNHFVNDQPITPPFSDHLELADFGLGCFWGAERIFWSLDGVDATAVGYMGGYTPNPTYEEVCSGMTGHTEAVRVIFDSKKISYEELLRVFWESHNPTQGMRQGNDLGTQYRSAVYTHNESQRKLALSSKDIYQLNLSEKSFGLITTEISNAENFYYAEDYHQQYLAKNPNGYCGIGGIGIDFRP
ncbi:peptide-methionine (S)-S-oxide reductase MsrA [Rhodobiaceae bacterium]|nr:peptide-methionine (S)-S-oxide reductase MsrA [Rhodobiaceae bacterium]